MALVPSRFPPLSPPPTSPLPPLPQERHQNSRPRRNRLWDHDIAHPVRPPRPKVSLLDTKPRTIVSPGHSPLRCRSEPLTRVFTPPSKLRHELTCHKFTDTQRKAFQTTSPTQTLSTIPALTSDFYPTPLDLSYVTPRTSDISHSLTSNSESAQSSGPRAWQVYHSRNTKATRQWGERRGKNGKQVFRTVLFVPRTACGPGGTTNESVLLLSQHLRTANSATSSTTVQEIVVDWATTLEVRPLDPFRKLKNNQKHEIHDSKHPSWYHRLHGWDLSYNDHITTSRLKVPCLVYGSTRRSTYSPNMQASSREQQCSKALSYLDEAYTFPAIPYQHPQLQARQKFSTLKKRNETMINRAISMALCHQKEDPESAAIDGIKVLSPEEMKAVQRRKILWIIATVSLVIAASAGILIGIVSRLIAIS